MSDPLQVYAIAALAAGAVAIGGRVLWYVHDLDKRRADTLAGLTRSEVIRVTGDPERRQAVSASEGEEQHAGAGGEVVASMLWLHAVADMPAVEHDILRVADAQVDEAGVAVEPSPLHREAIGRHLDLLG